MFRQLEVASLVANWVRQLIPHTPLYIGGGWNPPIRVSESASSIGGTGGGVL